jgi:type III pantothenate kinase
LSGKNDSRSRKILLVDVSNSFTKIALATGRRIGAVRRIPTSQLKKHDLAGIKADNAVIASVVPRLNSLIASALPCAALWVDHRVPGGVRIDYPKPSSIGADRLANAAAVAASGRLPAIIVDFGTAVTFDVIDARGHYLGGVIAPGLPTAAAALHERTALLPLTAVTSIRNSIGKSTAEAIRIGLLMGAAGLIRETIAGISQDAFRGKRPHVIATGGDAHLVDRLSRRNGSPVIDKVDTLLTLKGLLAIAEKNP